MLKQWIVPLNKCSENWRGNQEWTIHRHWQHCVQNTQDEDKQNKKHYTISVGHHYSQTNSNNVHTTWALLQTTGGKDKPNILCKPLYWSQATENVVVKYKLHTLVMLEYCYWWRESWLLVKWSQQVCRSVFILIIICCRLKVKVKVRSWHLSVSNILSFKHMLMDEMQIINGSRMVQWQNSIYIAEAGIKCLVYFFIFILEKPLKDISLISV